MASSYYVRLSTVGWRSSFTLDRNYLLTLWTRLVAPDSNYNPAVVAVGKVLRRTPLGKITVRDRMDLASRDPTVLEEHLADPRKWHTGLRVATGITLLEGLKEIARRAREFETPIKIIHGDHDRITSHNHSATFIEQAASKDKAIRLVPGGEHVLYTIGGTPEEDEPRQSVRTSCTICGGLWLIPFLALFRSCETVTPGSWSVLSHPNYDLYDL